MVSALARNAIHLDHQEVANVMYSLALMTFDSPYTQTTMDEFLLLENTSMNKLDLDSNNPTMILLNMHKVLISEFCRLDPALYSKENYDQFAMYFEMMRVIPGGTKLVDAVLSQHRGQSCYSGIESSLFLYLFLSIDSYIVIQYHVLLYRS